MESLEADPVVVRDVFPAEVATPDGMYRTARAIVTRERVYVWLADGVGARLVLSEPIDRDACTIASPNAPRSVSSHIVLAGQEAPTVHIARQRGCGCGNPLKSWQPWARHRVGPA